jgi:carbonic anhydrase
MKQLIHRLVSSSGPPPSRDHNQLVGDDPASANHVVVFACTDCPTRIDRILQAAPGDLLLLKNPGNIVPPYGSGSSGEAAALEHVIETGGVRDVVVLGHSDCGAIAKLLNSGSREEPTAIDSFLRHAGGVRRMLSERRYLRPDKIVEVAARENVLIQVAHVRGHHTVVKHRLSDPVRVHAWFFQPANDLILAFDEKQRQFLPLKLTYRYDDLQKANRG